MVVLSKLLRSLEEALIFATFRKYVSRRFIAGKDDQYKFFWVGNHAGTGGDGVLLAEK